MATLGNPQNTIEILKKYDKGSFYRITDYVTTSIQEATQSAGHQFDIIVRALDENGYVIQKDTLVTLPFFTPSTLKVFSEVSLFQTDLL